jgi:diguanylate cyclase (GGDEF)-like protein
MIVDECTRDLGDEGAVLVEGYYRHNGAWWNAATNKETDNVVGSELEKCLVSGGPYRPKKSRTSNFAIAEIQAVVRAEFEAALRQARLAAVQRIILRSYRNASNAFEVKYNPMTGLLAKTAFHQLVEQRLLGLASFPARSEDLPTDESSPPALCLLALDIDHFKQVNDSHGHAYGDLVIRAFAVRVEEAVRDFCKKNVAKLEATCAHVSGEEFFCIAWGEVGTQEFEALSAAILEGVRDKELPTDAEIELLKGSAAHHDLSMPVASHRNVTCSIGGVVTGMPTSRESQVSAAKLMNQADLALYKSKSQGRNRVTFFPAILQSGGRVLEYRSDVRICIVDVGSEVGVAKGQEFLVFHPEFTGQSPYVLDDGRSRKVLGKLPRVPLCTVTAFEVQRSISFCRVSEERFMSVDIPANAALEAIPLGTLSVVIAGPVAMTAEDESIASISSITETHRHISGETGVKSKISFAVIGLRNESQLLSEHGPAAVNRALATACRHLRKIPGIEFFGQIEATKLLLQFRSFADDKMQQLEEVLEGAEKDNSGRARYVAGVYAPGYGRAEGESELPAISSLQARADLARYAASPAGVLDVVRIHVFTYDSAGYVLSRQRQLREFKRGLADYERFSQIGIRGVRLDNLAGLMASASGDLKRAETLYLQAAEQAPKSEIMYRLNAISVQVRQNDLAAAARTLDHIDLDSLEKNYKSFPKSMSSLAIAVAEQATTDPQRRNAAKAWIGRALAMQPSEGFRSRLTVLLAALEGEAH